MSVSKISLSNPNYSKSLGFKGKNEENKYENPISRKYEQNLALLGSIAGSLVAGTAAWGLSCKSVLHKEGPTFLKRNKWTLLIGAVVALATFLITFPSKLYNTKVNAFVKEKEMDVFSRDRNLKSNLTEEVDKEVQDSEVSLDKKLDDNLKLQIANRGNTVAIANVG